MDTKEFSAKFADATWENALKLAARNPYWEEACHSMTYFPIAFELTFGRKPSRVEVAAYKLDLLEREHAFKLNRERILLGSAHSKPEGYLTAQRNAVAKLSAT